MADEIESATDEIESAAGDSWHVARCDDCGGGYFALGEADALCDRCAGWAEVGPIGCGE